MARSLDAIEHYPLFGVGIRNFAQYSGVWRVVHAAYLQIAAEGGIPVLVLYLLFFARGFSNLREVKKLGDADPDVVLMRGALLSSLVGFVVGACFAPEAYQFFPYFAVAYTSVLLWVVREKADPSKLPAKRQKYFLDFAEVHIKDEVPSILPAGR